MRCDTCNTPRLHAESIVFLRTTRIHAIVIYDVYTRVFTRQRVNEQRSCSDAERQINNVVHYRNIAKTGEHSEAVAFAKQKC